jgi:autotransporter-associated beta strand protein
MKPRINRFVRSAALATSLVLCLGSAARAATFYWDADGSATPGFGVAGGTWGSSAFWGTATAGDGATANTPITTADAVNFGTNSAGLGAGTITGPAVAEGFLSMTFGSASGNIVLSAGTLNLAATSTITVNNSAATVSSVLQGAGNLTKTGTGTLTLSGLNTHTLLTTASAGTLKVGHVNALGTAGSFASRTVISNGGSLELATDASVAAEWLDAGTGVTGTAVLNRATSGAGITHSLGTLYLGTGAKLNVAKGDKVDSGTSTLGLASLIMSGNAVGTATFNPTTAAVAITGSVSAGINQAKTLVLDGTNANNAISGVISNGSSVAGVSLLKSGSSTWKLSNTSTYTGSTTISGGTLTLDYTSAADKIADASVLALGGGTLNLANGASVYHEAFASTTLNAGASAVTQTSSATVLRMNAITRNVGSTVNFGAASIADTDSSNSSNGILGGWATVAGTDWAVSDASAADTAITAYSGYTNDTWAAANHVTVTGDSTQTSDSTANSLRFNAAGAYTVTLAGTNTLTTGGILVTGNVANHLSKITGGTLIGADSSDLVVHQNNTGNGLTIESILANNTAATALTKSGAGLLTLTANNTCTGGTYVNAGTLVLTGTTQTTGAVSVAAGAVLELKNSAGFANLVTLSGLGTVRLNGITTFGTAADVISLSPGALIDLRTSSFNGGASNNKNWVNNFASLNVEAGATFGTSQAAVRVDAITGLGDINASSSQTGGSFTFGVGNSSGSFGGRLVTTSTNKFNFTKLGTGTQTLTGANNYTSTMNVNAGVLAISGSGTLGASTAGLTMGGGQLDLGATSQTVGAVSVTGAYAGGDTLRNGSITGASYAASNATGNAVISANLLVNAAAAFAKSGAGSVTLAGVNTYAGGTTVSAGTLTLASTGQLRFVPTSNNISNKVSGAGAFNANGTFLLDLSGADATAGNSWLLVDVTTLTEDYDDASFTVNSSLGAFTETSPGVWEITASGKKWTFTESSGTLGVAATASDDYTTWANSFTPPAGLPGVDDDGDGLSNFEEYAFGLLPNNASSVNPISGQLNKSTGQFKYTRRAIPATTHVTYTYESSTTLSGIWPNFTPVSEQSNNASPIEEITVTIPGAPLTDPRFFLRVKAVK